MSLSKRIPDIIKLTAVRRLLVTLLTDDVEVKGLWRKCVEKTEEPKIDSLRFGCRDPLL